MVVLERGRRFRPFLKAASVPASQITLALSVYGVLALAGHALPAADFAVLSSFYLLVTVGRGIFSAAELEATRTVIAVRLDGGTGMAESVLMLRRTLLLTAGTAALVVAISPWLVQLTGSVGGIALLAGSALSIAASYFVRGPLAALRRHLAYSMTFLLEAVVGLAGAVVFVAAGVVDVLAWSSLFAVAPLVGSVAVAASTVGVPRLLAAVRDLGAPRHADLSSRSSFRALLWSATLLLASQGVWNLAPVIVTARLDEGIEPELAAGFAATAMLVRAPVIAFPALQALLLPRAVTEAHHSDDPVRLVSRRVSRLLPAVGLAWVGGATLLAAPVARIVFGVTATPGWAVVAGLSAATALGAIVQLWQTELVATGRQRPVALVWIGGLLVLLTVATLAPDAVTAAAAGLGGGVAVVGGVLFGVRRRVDGQRAAA